MNITPYLIIAWAQVEPYLPYVLATLAAFTTTFLRGFQNKNVAAGYRTLSFICGAAMAAMDGLVVLLVAKGGLTFLPCAALGAGCGWLAGMWAHDRMTLKRRLELKAAKKAKRAARIEKAIINYERRIENQGH